MQNKIDDLKCMGLNFYSQWMLPNQSWLHFANSHICKISFKLEPATGEKGNLALECTKYWRTRVDSCLVGNVVRTTTERNCF